MLFMVYGLYADCIDSLITSLACPCQFEGVRLGLGGQPWWLVTLARLGHPSTGALSQWALETVVLGSAPGWRVAWQGAWGYFNSGRFCLSLAPACSCWKCGGSAHKFACCPSLSRGMKGGNLHPPLCLLACLNVCLSLAVSAGLPFRFGWPRSILLSTVPFWVQWLSVLEGP